MLRSLYNEFQKTNPEKFNEDIIYARKNETSSVASYFDDFFKSMKHDGLTYLGCKVIHDESEFHKYVDSEYKDIEPKDSRMDLIISKFVIQANENEEPEELEFKLFFPKLIDNYYFKLAGNKYYAVYQLTDRNFYYSNKDGLFLKTLIMPLGIKPSYTSFKSYKNDKEFYANEFLLDYFKSNSSTGKRSAKNLFLQLFIKFGVHDSIDFMFNDKDNINVMLISGYDVPKEEIPPGYDCIKVYKDIFVLFVEKDHYNQQFLDGLATLVKALENIKRSEYMNDIDYWKRKFLNTSAPNLAKANRSILSLERILDNRTKKNLRECIFDENKEDVYSVIRWMMWNFYNLQNIDDVNIYNRRLRLFEYLFFPILKKTSKVSYRLLNSRVVDNKRLKTLFSNTKPMYIIKSTLTNDLIRYSNTASNLNLFTSLKWSIKGIQTVGGESGIVSMRFMNLHPTYIGNIGINSASADSPGVTGTLCPMNSHFDDMFFEDVDGLEDKIDYIHSKSQAYF